MVLTPSTMLPLGTLAPDFSLPDTDGNIVSLSDYADATALLVVFMCNHCPYVIHLKKELAELAGDYGNRGVATIGINANDVAKYPQDAPGKMAEDKAEFDYPFPYLMDETQEVAKAYRAACTPDFYVFDKDKRLAYRGQFDDSRPGGYGPITGSDIRAALEAVVAGQPVAGEQIASMGCNIKWKAGNEPDYFG